MICALLLLSLQSTFVERPQAEVLFADVPENFQAFGRGIAFSRSEILVADYGLHYETITNSLGGLTGGAISVFARSGASSVRSELLLHPEPRHRFSFADLMLTAGNRLVITDGRAIDNGLPVFFGRAYIYEKTAGGWTLIQTLLSSYAVNGSLGFGTSGDLDGDRLVLLEPGNPGLGDPNTGIVRVFDHDGQQFVETARVTSPPELAAIPGGTNSPLNSRITLDGDTMMMGVRGGGRRAIVWERNAAGVWEFKQQIEPPPFSLTSRFPRSLTLDGDWAVAGHTPDEAGSLNGRVEVFRRNPASTMWEHHQTLQASDGLPSGHQGFDYFGVSVDMDGDRILVGAPLTRNASGVRAGAAYTFLLGLDGYWHPEAVLRTDRAIAMTTGSGPYVGENVALADGIAAVYSPADYAIDPAIKEGSTAVFELPIGQLTCDGRPNSVSPAGARMEVLGRPFASYEAWTIEGRDLPAGAAVLPLMGTMQGSTIFSHGELCLGGAVFRLGSAFGFTDGNGTFSRSYESGDGLVEPQVLAGSTWHFQLWYRDLLPAPVSNFSNAVRLTFQ